MSLCIQPRFLKMTIIPATRIPSRCGRAVVIVIMAFGISRPAAADPVTYQLFVAATTGPLLGQTSTGTVTFDSSIIPAAGGQVIGPHLFTSVNFQWNNILYDASTTKTSFLQFNSGGILTQWDFGTACISPTAGGCLVRLVSPGFEDWVVKNTATHHLFFEYGQPDRSFGFGTATLTASAAAPTPEPVSAALLLTGLAGFCVRQLRSHG